MKTGFLEAALGYAELGYRVLPCAPGSKRPLTPKGLLDATADSAAIEAWWSLHPQANLAIATAGLLVVDFDTLPAGSPNPWLSDHPDLALELAAAPMAVTPRGGRHYVFLQPAGMPLRNTAGKLAPHVDTRADGGYILVAPSVVDGKAYRWAGDGLDVSPDRLPEPPAWLLAMLSGQEKPSGRDEPAPSNAIRQGQRNGTLTSLAGTMRRVGMSQAAIEVALIQENADRCRPPLDDAEVRTIAKFEFRSLC